MTIKVLAYYVFRDGPVGDWRIPPPCPKTSTPRFRTVRMPLCAYGLKQQKAEMLSA